MWRGLKKKNRKVNRDNWVSRCSSTYHCDLRTMPAKEYPCMCCTKQFSTLKGLRSHRSQRETCRIRQHNPLSSPSESSPSPSIGSLPDHDVQPPHLYLKPEMEFFQASDTHRDETTNSAQPHRRKRTRIEEVEDEDAPGRKEYLRRWVESFPGPAGLAKPGKVDTTFEKLQAEGKSQGNAPWAPFDSEEDWEFARWLMTSGVGQKQMDKLLKLSIVRIRP